MIHRKHILAATLAAAAALAAPLSAPAQVAAPSAPMPSYARAFVRDPFPFARPVAAVRVRHAHHRYAYHYPAYVYPYPAYPYPVYGYGYPGWYGPAFSVGIGFRFGGCCYARVGRRWR